MNQGDDEHSSSVIIDRPVRHRSIQAQPASTILDHIDSCLDLSCHPSLHSGTDIAIEALASLPNLLHARAVRMFRTLGLCRTISLATVDGAAQVGFPCPESSIFIRLRAVGHRFDRTP